VSDDSRDRHEHDGPDGHERVPIGQTYATIPPRALARQVSPRVVTVRGVLTGPTARRLLVLAVGAVLMLALLDLVSARTPEPLSPEGRVTVAVFIAAVWAWVFSSVDDTYIALGAAVTLVLAGALPTEEFFSTLGDDTVWLLLGAFVIAAGVTQSGLATRTAALVVVGARTPRQLFHLVTAALVVTTFAVPSTSGRAALALPVFVALVHAVARQVDLTKALGLLFPTVILLSAVGSLLGAGAHLVTSQVLQTATGEGIDFATWLKLGLPLAVVSSHLAAEVVLHQFTDRGKRQRPLALDIADFADARHDIPLTGPFSTAQSRSALLVCAVVALWCTEPLHGVDPAVIALVGALVATSPRLGSVDLGGALKSAPWSLLLFLAATLALGSALISTGAAEWFAGSMLAPLGSGGGASVFLVAVVVLSTGMHLVVQSRSARSSVLIPMVVALAPAAGLSPAAVAFASTAAAGFCHTMTSSAKPVAMFGRIDDLDTFEGRDLLRLSAVLAPLHVGLVLLFSFLVWPVLGLPLMP
jgi:anion transporter